ncbi:hypothetical protein RchiOBHm_Chr4g0393401 [Rosa chinensis]|uniref:Uncharacterized protein n=1 Tax=Rosa chinensis TaxID=74649 RepID=A0A2P6QQY5_ROSCH|nr:hypothetical protein RchiOBHm_Chr4g0393401 [Rosa chinensis]
MHTPPPLLFSLLFCSYYINFINIVFRLILLVLFVSLLQVLCKKVLLSFFCHCSFVY